jgi:RNA polymerase sigma-70 factor (family 1)
MEVPGAPKVKEDSNRMETTTKKLISYPVESYGELTFEELYRHYFVRLFRFCFSIVHQKESAEEIVNDVFLKLWEKSSGGPVIGNYELYLYVAVKNRSLNYLRDHSSFTTIELSERCDEYIRFEADPETLMVGAEVYQRVRSVINRLPPRCKLIFSLVKEDQLKYKDVARLLEVSVKTVEAQLAIALRKIAAALEK